ncbi:MAG: hypothetical protein FJ284_06230 [Planctomycetes bacterium]|nr:hypothetical protein [Planctomycetota bacterium]
MLPLALGISPVFCCIGAVQVLGLAAAAAARLTEGTRHETVGQLLCLGALAVVGTVCGMAIQFGPDAAAASAAALALMTLITVADFSARR